MNILVFGSKPNPIIKINKPNIIITANTSIKTIDDYFNHVPNKISILSDQVLSNNEPDHQKGSLNSAREYMRESKCRTLIIIKTLNNNKILKPEDYISYKKKIYLNPFKYQLYFASKIGLLNNIKDLILSVITFKIFKHIYKSIKLGLYPPFEISTGMIALWYAIDNFPNAQIYVSGIGLNPDSGYVFKTKFRYESYHIKTDEKFLAVLNQKKLLKNVDFDDEMINKILHRKQ